jgi:predicted house-cleaning noncanonical NTP pyrophosphatase (MazG superfamily)
LVRGRTSQRIARQVIYEYIKIALNSTEGVYNKELFLKLSEVISELSNDDASRQLDKNSLVRLISGLMRPAADHMRSCIFVEARRMNQDTDELFESAKLELPELIRPISESATFWTLLTAQGIVHGDKIQWRRMGASLRALNIQGMIRAGEYDVKVRIGPTNRDTLASVANSVVIQGSKMWSSYYEGTKIAAYALRTRLGTKINSVEIKYAYASLTWELRSRVTSTLRCTWVGHESDANELTQFPNVLVRLVPNSGLAFAVGWEATRQVNAYNASLSKLLGTASSALRLHLIPEAVNWADPSSFPLLTTTNRVNNVAGHAGASSTGRMHRYVASPGKLAADIFKTAMEMCDDIVSLYTRVNLPASLITEQHAMKRAEPIEIVVADVSIGIGMDRITELLMNEGRIGGWEAFQVHYENNRDLKDIFFERLSEELNPDHFEAIMLADYDSATQWHETAVAALNENEAQTDVIGPTNTLV